MSTSKCFNNFCEDLINYKICLLLQKHDTVDVRFKVKNPRTNTFIWTANALLIGGKDYIEQWKQDAWVQITNAGGDINFVPLVPLVDPDLTIYDDVNQVLLECYEGGSQGAKKRPAPIVNDHCAVESLIPENQGQIVECANIISEENNYPELDPNDVSRCLNEIPNLAEEVANRSNCSSISANQVI